MNNQTSPPVSPATAPSSASIMGGGVGKRLFEPSDFIGEFPIAAHKAEQRRKQAIGGALFFGYLLLSKQKKVTRLEAKKKVSYGVLQASISYVG